METPQYFNEKMVSSHPSFHLIKKVFIFFEQNQLIEKHICNPIYSSDKEIPVFNQCFHC